MPIDTRTILTALTMQKKLAAIVLIFLLHESAAQQQPLTATIELTFHSDLIEIATIKSIAVSQKPLTPPPTPGPYSLVIYDDKNNEIQNIQFSVDYTEVKDSQGLTVQIPRTFTLPYTDKWHHIEIKKQQQTLATQQIATKLCNFDNLCNNLENHLTCQKDCTQSSPDGLCETIKDGTCDPDCTPQEDPDCLVQRARCGDGTCNPPRENITSCPQDCATTTTTTTTTTTITYTPTSTTENTATNPTTTIETARCGDGTCDSDETPQTCPQDCTQNQQSNSPALPLSDMLMGKTASPYPIILLMIGLSSIIYLIYRMKSG
ncbi:Uncharacterised protein [uncultured archaeon]|nr:Uncharacterised protein [uncultured archaeon]